MNSLFTRELEHLINKYSMENESNTPDYILAKYLERCMTNYALTISETDKHKGKPFINPEYIQADGMHKIGTSLEDFKEIQVGPPFNPPTSPSN